MIDGSVWGKTLGVGLPKQVKEVVELNWDDVGEYGLGDGCDNE